MKKRLFLLVITLMSIFTLTLMMAGVVAADVIPKQIDRPFVKLFTFIAPGPFEDITQEEIEWIANTYSWINSHGGSWLKPVGAHTLEHHWEYFAGKSGGVDEKGRTVGDRLREVNPDIILTNYRNGTYTSQNAIYEAGDVEENLPLAIAVYDAGLKLREVVSKDTETILITPLPLEDIPEGKPQYYPFKASTTDYNFSIDKKQYMAWFRLDDEMIRIDNVKLSGYGEGLSGGLIELDVTRGYSKTESAVHDADSLVLLPVYNGGIRKGKEYWLSGLPDGNGPQKGLRYVMMPQKEEFQTWLGDIVEEIFDEGLNGPWLDCAVSSKINHANAYGMPNIEPYDVDLKRTLDRESYREYQQGKIDYLFNRFPEGEFYVNWFFPQFYFDNGHERYMFSGENNHHAISGGSMELYTIQVQDPEGNKLGHWLDERKMQIDMVKNDFRVVSWVKSHQGEAWEEFPPEYALFAYGTFLLTYEKDAEQYWGARGNPEPHLALSPEEGPPSFVYWDLGEPLQSFSHIPEAELNDFPGVYSRKFSKGLVVVNPDPENDKEINLDDNYYEPESGEWVDRLELTPRSARILLKSVN